MTLSRRRPNRLVVLATAAAWVALERGSGPQGAGLGLHAVVLNSGAYPPQLVARAFGTTLVAARRVVEEEYFDSARHSALFYNASQRALSVQRVVDFLKRQGFE